MPFAEPNASKVEFPTFVPPVEPPQSSVFDHKPRKKSFFNKKTIQLVFASILLLIVVVGGGASYFLAQNNQDVRNQASEIKQDETTKQDETKPTEPEVTVETPVETTPAETKEPEVKPPETNPQPDTKTDNTDPKTYYTNLQSTFRSTNIPGRVQGNITFDYSGPPKPNEPGVYWTITYSTTESLSDPRSITNRGSSSPDPTKIVINDIITFGEVMFYCNDALYWAVTDSSGNPLSAIQRTTILCQEQPPTPSNDFSELQAFLLENQAGFSFKYSGKSAPAGFTGQISSTADFSSDVIDPFGTDTYKPDKELQSIQVKQLPKWDKYVCNATLYWRIKYTIQGSDTVYFSPIQKAQVLRCDTGESHISNMNATLGSEEALFTFSHAGDWPAEFFTVQTSTSQTFSSNNDLDFQRVNFNPNKATQTGERAYPHYWDGYTCNSTIYWRVKHSNRSNKEFYSPVSSSVIKCDVEINNLTAVLEQQKATFSFDYTGKPTSRLEVVIAADPAFTQKREAYIVQQQNTKATNQVLIKQNPATSNIYYCGATVYYRILYRTQDGQASSNTKSAVVNCQQGTNTTSGNSTTDSTSNNTNSGSSSNSSGNNINGTGGSSSTSNSGTNNTNNNGGSSATNNNGTQPVLPDELPQTGAGDVSTWVKAGLGTLGLGILFLLLL